MAQSKSTSTEQARRLAVLAPRIMGAFHSLNRHHAEGTQVTMRQYQTLILLSVQGHLTATALCERLKLAPSTGTELANRLRQLELVGKHSEEADRRQVGIQLTAAGREVMEQRQRDMELMFEQLLARFTPEEAEELLAAFDKIAALMQGRFQPSAAEAKEAP